MLWGAFMTPVADLSSLRVDHALARERMVTVGLPIVYRVARRIARRLPSSIEVDDLVGAGTEGLMRAIAAYDSDRGNMFEPYAEARIRGAILDELRAGDSVTQYARRRLAAARRAAVALEATLGRAPTEAEIAAEAGVSIAAYRELLAGVAHAGTMAFGVGDPDAFASADPDACALYGLAEERRRLAAAIAKLSPRLQEVLGLYYQHECTQAEIGRLLGITESRVCQLLAESVAHLRRALRERVAASEPS